MQVVGKPTPRLDGVTKVTGGTTYVSDMKVPGMLYGKVLRSPIAHGTIKSIDVSTAEAMDGVMAVVTVKDTPKKKFSFAGGIVPDLADKLILSDGRVRYIGDEIAAVAAESEEIADAAIQSIEIEFEELPGVFTPEDALKEDAPKIHEKGNLSYSRVFNLGNVDEAFKEPGLIFVEETFVTQKAAHVCLEPKGCVADWSAPTGELTITTTTQAPHTLKEELSRTLDVPVSKVRVVYPASGGGFGSKLVMSAIEPIAALLSRKSGRPVRIINTRAEEFETSRTDYPYDMHVKMGFTPQGKIVGVDAKIVVDNGAYNDKGPAVLARSTLALGSHYNIPNIRASSYLVYTNKQYCTAFRGFGKPQAVFAIESIIEMAAEKIQMDSIKFREINATKAGETTPVGVPIFNEGLELCIQEAAKRIGWEEHQREKKTKGVHRDQNARYVTGIGFAADAGTAAGNRKYGFNSSEAFIKLSDDGTATLITSGVEIGTGAATALAQIVAEILGLGVEDVKVIGYDTSVTPYDLGVFGNRTLFIHGNAASAAAQNAKKQLLSVAAIMLGEKVEDLVISKGHVVSTKDSSKSAPMKDVAKFARAKLGKSISANGQYIDDQAPLAPSGKAPIDPTYSFAAHAVKLQVDLETGLVKILNYIAAHDSGTIINPLTAKGVVIGGLVQGIGYTLMEDLITEEGRVINPNFLDYKIPSMEESPSGVDVVFVNVPDPLGPFGAKGLGENAASPPVAALANALYDATGIRFTKLPITPVRILEAINEMKEKSRSTPVLASKAVA